MEQVTRNSEIMQQMVSAGNNFFAKNQKFPSVLSEMDSVVISIYDSSQNDAIDKMSDGVAKVASMQQKAFGSDGGYGQYGRFEFFKFCRCSGRNVDKPWNY